MDGPAGPAPAALTDGGGLSLAAILDSVQRGEITLHYAEEMIRGRPSADTDDAVKVLATQAVALAQSHPWAAVVPARLAAAAVDTEEPFSGRETPWLEGNLAWLDVAGRAVERCPDARLQRHAAVRGERVRRWAEVRGHHELRARACTLIAALALRLHRAAPPRGYAELDEPVWSARLALHADERLGLDLLAPGTFDYPQNPLRPAPWERAAWVAEAHLREALALNPPVSRGSPAGELARLLITAGTLDPHELGRRTRQALGGAGGLSRAGILALHRRLGMTKDVAWLAELGEIDVEAAVDELGLVDACRIAVDVLDSIADEAPDAGLAWARRWEPAVMASGDDLVVEYHWFRRAGAVAAVLNRRAAASPDGLEGLQPDEQLFLSAMAMLGADQPLPASNILSLLNAMPGDLVAGHQATFRWLVMHARLRAALKLDWPTRLPLLTDVLVDMLTMGFRAWPMMVLLNVMNELDHPAPQETDLWITFLERLVIPLERAYGDAALEFVHEIAMHLVDGLFPRSINTGQALTPVNVVGLLQVISGARYAAAVRARARVATAGDADVEAALERVRHWQRQRDDRSAAGEGQEDAFNNLHFETAVTSYATGSEQSDGAGPEAVLGNVQMRADALLDARLLDAVPNDDPPSLSLEELRANLDPRTALLLTFIGRIDPPVGPPCLFTVLISHETIICAGIKEENLPGNAHVWTAPDGGLWLTSSLGTTVAQLRRLVREYSRPDLMSAAAEETLASDGQVEHYLGQVVREEMERLRKRGVDHLCVVPYGPLRVFPMHLLGAPGRMLADDWIVTYLPHATLLGRQPSTSPARTHPITSVGISYTALGMAEPSNAPVDTSGQARAVAALFGAIPLLDAQATPEAVVDAMLTSRRVHIAAHGKMNARAPAFQSMQLAPGEGGSHRLSAADLLGLDLDGLELVTLSSCESALGRFDHADNPRGLAATLLLRGAGAVVGTLWPVKARVAETFFPLLYGELSHGLCVLDAYAVALRSTRRTHPELRDWGAFYFLGDWRIREGDTP